MTDDIWFFPARILLYQAFSLDSVFESGQVSDVDDLVDILEERHDAYEMRLRYVPVVPQPALDFAVPHYATDVAMVPICVQVERLRQPVRFWMDFCEPNLTLAQLQVLLDQDWFPGDKAFVGADSLPLSETDSRPITQGTLVRIVPEKRSPVRVHTLEVKLRFPGRFFRDLDTAPLPEEIRNRLRLALSQPLCQLHVVEFNASGGLTEVAQELTTQIVRDWGPVRYHWPARPIADLLVRGGHVHRVVGIFPQRTQTRVPLFVDGRKLCLPVQLYASLQGCMPLSVFLDQIGLRLPRPEAIHLTGTVLFDRTARTVHVRPGDLAVLSIDEEGSVSDEPLHPFHTSDGPHEGPSRHCPPDTSLADGLPHTCVAPGQALVSSSTGPACRTAYTCSPSCHQHGASADDPPIFAVDLASKRNPGLLEHAHAVRHQGDASAEQVPVEPSYLPPAGSQQACGLSPFALSREMELELLNAAPVVEQTGELPPLTWQLLHRIFCLFRLTRRQ